MMNIRKNNQSVNLSSESLESLLELFDGYGMVITDSDLIKKRIKQLNLEQNNN